MPFDAGAVKLTCAWALPAVAVPITGAPGTVTKSTTGALVRFVPVIVTVVPPDVGPALGLMTLTAGACANAVPGSSRHIRISQPAAVALWRRRGPCVPFSPDGFLRPFFRRFFGSSPCPGCRLGVGRN